MNNQYPLPIHHDGSMNYLRFEANQPQMDGRAIIRLKTFPEEKPERVFVRTCPDGEEHFVEMKLIGDETPYQWWEAAVALDMPVVNYRFLVFYHEKALWYNGKGLFEELPTDNDDFRILTTYQPVDWLQGSVFYQIFPDRFCDGDPDNNVRDGEFEYGGEKSRQMPWGTHSQARGRAKSLEFYGGDLAGIEQRLPYLVDLGINAIYLTPIFPAYSNHRYDVIDYFDVDQHLGGKEAFVRLRNKSRELGLRIMLDIVPNHCGVMHPWFQEAVKDESASTAEFFTFYQHPREYASWLGVKSLPKLNYKSRLLREKMFGGENSVFRYWMREPYDIDGWRIDVANMLARQGADQAGMEIGKEIRAAVKKEKPDAYLLGENFFDGTWQLQGDFLDANMNYSGFMRPVWQWLTQFGIWNREKREYVTTDQPISTAAMVANWTNYMACVPWVIVQQQFNLLDSHDTDRIKTIVASDDEQHRLAVAFLLTFPGVPCIYYGDEIGMVSHDGDSRACMQWDETKWDVNLREYYRKLIELRKTSPALRQGSFEVVLVEKDIVAYFRQAGDDQILVVGNRGDAVDGFTVAISANTSDNNTWMDVITGAKILVKDGCWTFTRIARGASIWRKCE